MNDDEKRALAAYTDVLAVEWDADAGVARILTLSDVYHAVPSEGMHLCPDREYHDVDRCKHIHAIDAVRGRSDAPVGWLVVEDFDDRTDPEFDLEVPDRIGRNRTLAAFEMRGGRAMTDGGQVDAERSGNRPEGHDQWTVWDPDRENARHFDSRSAAEDRQESAAEDFGIDADLYPPGESPEALYHADSPTEDDGDEGADDTDADAEKDDDPEPDGGETVEAEVIDHSSDAVEVENPDPQPVDADTEAMDQVEHDELPERSVSDDPLTWVPGEFVDEIDGSQAINRKGFEVLSHFYDVDTTSTLQVPPESTDHTYCRVKATAEIDGRTVEAFGSAHVDRGDDAVLLLEMADTRARKRALSVATGVGAVAVEELKNEVGQ